MAINIVAEVDKIQEVSQKINTVTVTLASNQNISSAIKAAHIVATSEFVKYMSALSFTNPQAYSHMYEWNRVGDPNSRLWKHILRGGGRMRKSFFEFKASKTTVPVDPRLSAVGVKRNHIFVWKAPILEFGLPVRISPKLASALVYIHKGESTGKGKFSGFVKNGIVYRKSPVLIQRAGNKMMWGSFSQAYTKWFSSSAPSQAIETGLANQIKNSISRVAKQDLKKINSRRKKTIEIDPMAIDPSIGTKLQEALRRDYTNAAKNRLVEE